VAIIRSGGARWNELHLSVFDEPLSTGTHVLSRHQVDRWMQQTPTASGAWLTNFAGPMVASTAHLSTTAMNAELLWERTESNGPSTARYRYYRYPIVRLTDGRAYCVGPKKDLTEFPFSHHESERPIYLREICAASTSTGW
jgi:hypothetical protein